MRVWDVETGKELLTLTEYAYRMSNVAFSPDGKRLAAASPVGCGDVAADTGQEQLTISAAHSGGTASVTFSPRRQAPRRPC